MKKILLFILLLIPFSSAEAVFCSFEKLANNKKLASNISAYYDPVEIDGKITFSVTLVNTPDLFYIVDKSTNQMYTGKEIVISNYLPGQSLNYDVRTYKNNCEGTLITISIKLPSYNPYYQDKLCSTIPNYELCQKWSSHGSNYNEFKKNVTEHLNSLINEKPKENEVIDETGLWEVIVSLITKYYYIPIILIILGCSLGIYYVDKKSNKYY